MTEIPSPMTPADCDLRGYEFMPLFGAKLFGSKLYSKALRNPRAGMAALKLWWVAWQQCPAGSLPDDDDDLAMYADFGMDLKGWQKAREIALHGFVKCSDGRLYHPILCVEAKSAFEKRQKDRARKAEFRARRNGTSGDDPPSGNASVPRDTTRTEQPQDTGQDADFRSDRTGQDRTEERKKDSALRAGVSADAVPPADGGIFDPRKAVWTAGVERLIALTGLSAARARPRMGQLLRDAGDDCAALLGVLTDCPQTPEANAWLTKAALGIKSRNTGGHDPTIAMRRDWHLTSFADPGLLADLENETPNRRLIQ